MSEQKERNEQPSGDWFTVSDVAKRFRVTKRAVQKWIKQGLLPGTLQMTRRGHYRIPQSAVEHFEKNHRVY